MSNELTVTKGDRPIARGGKINYALLTEVANAYKEQQAQYDDRPAVPGTLLLFKQGEWLIEGDERKRLATGTGFIVDFANLTFAWRKFKDVTDKNGKPVLNHKGNPKRYPEHAAVAYPFAGEVLPDRDTLGDLDKSLWGKYQGRPEDPWSMVVCVPMYLDDEGHKRDGELFRFEASGISAVNRVKRLMAQFATEARMQEPNSFPVIEIDYESAERKTEDGEVQRWKVPVLDIVDAEWVPDDELEDLRQDAIAKAEADAENAREEAKANRDKAEDDQPKGRRTRGASQPAGGKSAARKSSEKRDPTPEVAASEADDDDADAEIVTRGKAKVEAKAEAKVEAKAEEDDDAPPAAATARTSRRRMGRRD